MTKNEMLLIKKALLHVEMKEVKCMESFPQIDLPHSKQYIENMASITCRTKTVKNKRVFSKRKLLIGIAAALLSFILTFVTACAFKEPILNFLEEIYEGFTKLSANQDTDKGIDDIYMPAYLPSGYEIASQSNNQMGLSVIFSNGNDKIIYNQSALNNENIFIDTENNNYVTLYIEEQPVYYILKNNVHLLIWENGLYSFKLRCPESMPQEEIERIISGIDKQPE